MCVPDTLCNENEVGYKSFKLIILLKRLKLYENMKA